MRLFHSHQTGNNGRCYWCTSFGCRISVDKRDPGYNPTAIGAIVYLDDQVLKHAITADMARGYVLVHTVDNSQNAIVSTYSGEPHIQRHTIRGTVSLTLPATFTPYLTQPDHGPAYERLLRRERFNEFQQELSQ